MFINMFMFIVCLNVYLVCAHNVFYFSLLNMSKGLKPMDIICHIYICFNVLLPVSLKLKHILFPQKEKTKVKGTVCNILPIKQNCIQALILLQMFYP